MTQRASPTRVSGRPLLQVFRPRGSIFAFNATLRTAVTSYVHTAKSLRKVVPPRLRDDVDSMITAAKQRHFSDAAAARNAIDDYAQTVCKTT